MLTSFRLQVVVAVAAAVVVRQQVVVAVVVARQQAVVAAVVVERAVAVQQAFALLQAVPQAFAGKKLPTEPCLPLQVAITFSFCLPPKKFYFYYILKLNRLSSFLEAVLKIQTH
jgi:hypothetical protein